MLLNPKSLLIATKQLVFFSDLKSVNNLLHQRLFWMVYVYNFWLSGIPWCVDKCINEGWYSETSEITVQCSKQTQRHFWSVFSCSKKHSISCLLHANVCLQIVEQIHMYTSMKRLHGAYNNANQIMHYTPRNVSVYPHQVGDCVRTSDVLLRNNLYWYFMQCASLSIIFCRIASNVWCFLQIFILPQLFNAPIWWRPTAIVVGALFQCSCLINIASA